MSTSDRPAWLPAEEFPFQSRFLDLDGHRIHHVDEGSGPALLFLHAGPAWSFVYRDVIDRLRPEFRCVTLDLPGTGLSHAADGYRPGVEAASRVLEQFVLALDLRDITLVVHDVGGPVAFGLAARHPDRIRGIAITESFGWALPDENPRVARMLRMVGSRTFSAVNAATNVVARGMSSNLVARAMSAPRYLTRAEQVAFRGPFRDRKVRRTGLAMLRDAAQANTYLRDVHRALRTTLNDRPVILVYGEKSPVRREFLPQWQAIFPHARVVLVEGGHHFPPIDAPDVVANALRSWWRETVDRGPDIRHV
jgi:haloalkane dehalogenase